MKTNLYGIFYRNRNSKFTKTPYHGLLFKNSKSAKDAADKAKIVTRKKVKIMNLSAAEKKGQNDPKYKLIYKKLNGGVGIYQVNEISKMNSRYMLVIVNGKGHRTFVLNRICEFKPIK